MSLTGLMLVCLLWQSDNTVPPLTRIPPQEPATAHQSFTLRPGFQMQLLAAEPLVTDPVAMEYDEDGRAYVAEMRDYPFTDKTADKPFTEKTADLPLGRIRLLTDDNGDGVFDRSSIFADNLSWPTGLALWKGGLFVVATPDLWYLKDTDGDGQADVRQKVLTGFRKFNVQAVINNLKWGLDHRIYGAGSSNGGRLVPGDGSSTAPLVMATGDFRFPPDKPAEAFELLSGGARFGNTFDDWGHRFICNIRNPIQHVVLPRHYLARNRYAAFRSALQDVAASGDTVPVWRTSPPEPWRVRNARRLADDPTVASPRSETVATGYMTSASGLTIYRGDAYPAEYYGTMFLGEVAGNLIHHQQPTRAGVTFTSQRTSQESEFLASSDNWFRPVNFVNAPDGTLHVLDMYRETIEHPWSIPDDIKAELDLESGRDRGRIWRLAPLNFTPPAAPRLSQASTAELVSLLSSPKSWYRDTAHRLLFERQPADAVPLLRQLLSSADAADRAAVARLHALWSLQGLQALQAQDLHTALQDPHAGVRTAAVQLAEPLLADHTDLAQLVCRLADDPDPEVRFQTAFSLGALLQTAEQALPEAITAVAHIARRDAGDPFIRAAVLSSTAQVSARVIGQYVAAPGRAASDSGAAAAGSPLQDLAFVIGARGDAAELALLFQEARPVAMDPQRSAELRDITVGLGLGLRRGGKSLQELLNSHQSAPAAAAMLSLLNTAMQRLAGGNPAEPESPESQQQTALLLSFLDYASVREPLLQWLAADQPPERQAVAVRVLAGHRQPDIAPQLISAWKGLRPVARTEAVEALVSRAEWHADLLTAVEAGTIPVFDIPHLRRNLLLRSANADVKARAVRLFSAALSARRDVINRYRDALPGLTPDRRQGEQVYLRECQNCHRVGAAGQDLGPNLATIRNRAPDEVLLHILDPNREVAPNYVAQVVVTREGQVLTGLITEDTTNQITLKLPTGTESVLPRAAIEEVSSTGQSLMPVGFEQRISEQDMASLLEFLLR